MNWKLEDIEPIPTAVEVSLKMAQRFVLGNDKLYELGDQLIMGKQKLSIEQEV